MDQLPARLLLRLLEGLHLVIGGDIFVQRAQHDHGYDSSQEEDDHETVHDREIVNLIVGVSLEIHVPSIRPQQIRLLPLHVVGVNDLSGLVYRLELVGIMRRGVELIAGHQHRVGQVEISLALVILMLHPITSH